MQAPGGRPSRENLNACFDDSDAVRPTPTPSRTRCARTAPPAATGLSAATCGISGRRIHKGSVPAPPRPACGCVRGAGWLSLSEPGRPRKLPRQWPGSAPGRIPQRDPRAAAATRRPWTGGRWPGRPTANGCGASDRSCPITDFNNLKASCLSGVRPHGHCEPSAAGLCLAGSASDSAQDGEVADRWRKSGTHEGSKGGQFNM